MELSILLFSRKSMGTLGLLILFLGCGGSSSVPFNNAAFNVNSQRFLYVASGPCYGGGVAVSAGPANTVSKFNLTTGKFEGVVIDYNQLAPGDSPVSIHDYDSAHLLVLVENAAGRRIDLVRKDGGGYTTYLVNAAGLNAVMRSIVLLNDFSVLVSKSSAIEKFNSGKARITQGANPFVSAPAGACATSATLLSSFAISATGKIVFTHAAASPNNKIGVISATGYAAAPDCLGSQAAPTALTMPTRALFHSSGKLLVSFGSTTVANNYIYSYDFDENTGAISNATAAYSDGGAIVNGPSVMVEDTTTGDVFVANVTATYNTIERFHVSGGVMTRAAGNTFIPSGVYNRCVADMKVMN